MFHNADTACKVCTQILPRSQSLNLHPQRLCIRSSPICQNLLLLIRRYLPFRLRELRAPLVTWVRRPELIYNGVNHDSLAVDGQSAVRGDRHPVIYTCC